jgi:hypothetical protein
MSLICFWVIKDFLNYKCCYLFPVYNCHSNDDLLNLFIFQLLIYLDMDY